MHVAENDVGSEFCRKVKPLYAVFGFECIVPPHFQRSRKCLTKCRFIIDNKDGFHSRSPVIGLSKVTNAIEKINKVLINLKISLTRSVDEETSGSKGELKRQKISCFHAEGD